MNIEIASIIFEICMVPEYFWHGTTWDRRVDFFRRWYGQRFAWWKKWCHVGDIATKKNCDFASGYEQFAGYNTLFHNHDANPIKPNTNYNHKTDLA